MYAALFGELISSFFVGLIVSARQTVYQDFFLYFPSLSVNNLIVFNELGTKVINRFYQSLFVF